MEQELQIPNSRTDQTTVVIPIPPPNLTTLRAVVPIWLLMQDGEMRYILHAVGYFVGQEAILSIRAWLWS